MKKNEEEIKICCGHYYCRPSCPIGGVKNEEE